MKVIITGSTGMIGGGALLECIDNPKVEQVLLINRHSKEINHPKVKEVLVKDLSNLESIKDQLSGYDLCIHAMGVSAANLDEDQYTHLTFDITKELVDTLYQVNPNMVFCYVSGLGTDSSEKGRIMWARVKGRTENYIKNKGFKDVYLFRPGGILPERGLRSRTKLYDRIYMVMRPFFPLLRRLDSITTTTILGQGFLKVAMNPIEKKYLENKDINKLQF